MNGRLVPARDARISVFDHGLLYGDGVFEGIRTYRGRVFMLEQHLDRLYRSAKAIDLAIPLGREAMARAVVRTCRANRTMNGYVRLVVTRGVGTLGLNPYVCRRPQVIIIAATIQLYPRTLYEEGLSIITVGTIRNHTESVSPQIKSLNYLNNVLAKIEAINAGCMEAILLNPQGFVAEATGDNLFVVRGETVITPPTWCGTLEGITRDVVIKLAGEAGRTVREDVLTRYDLYTADEVFLTGTAAEVIPVVRIDRRRIGTGRPGPVTRDLERRFHQYASSTGVPIA
jgi:branched-chain amino acid aminotransferase